MADDGQTFEERLKLVERARESVYFRKLDEALLADMRAAAKAEKERESVRGFEKILVPVDFSESSAKALDRAAELAETYGSSVVALHVVPRDSIARAASGIVGGPGGGTAGMAIDQAQLEAVVIDHREQGQAELQAFLPSRFAELPVEMRVVVGHPFERIVETAHHDGVDLIVLGTHGRTGLSHAFMGSVAERVVRLAPCPVLTVKAETATESNWLRDVYEAFVPPKS